MSAGAKLAEGTGRTTGILAGQTMGVGDKSLVFCLESEILEIEFSACEHSRGDFAVLACNLCHPSNA